MSEDKKQINTFWENDQFVSNWANVAIAVFTIVSVVFSLWFGISQNRRASKEFEITNRPYLFILPNFKYYFGKDKLQYELHIKNSGETPAILKSFNNSCGTTVDGPMSELIPKDEQFVHHMEINGTQEKFSCVIDFSYSSATIEVEKKYKTIYTIDFTNDFVNNRSDIKTTNIEISDNT